MFCILTEIKSQTFGLASLVGLLESPCDPLYGFSCNFGAKVSIKGRWSSSLRQEKTWLLTVHHGLIYLSLMKTHQPQHNVYFSVHTSNLLHVTEDVLPAVEHSPSFLRVKLVDEVSGEVLVAVLISKTHHKVDGPVKGSLHQITKW